MSKLSKLEQNFLKKPVSKNFNKWERREVKRLQRWQGANYSTRSTCSSCGKRRQVGYIHCDSPRRIAYLNKLMLVDHIGLCSECWEHAPKGWTPCGCGG